MSETSAVPALRWGIRAQRTGSLAVALAAAAVFAVACSNSPSSPGVAGAPQNSSASASANSAGPLAFSECMRTHGISNFPDPNSNGGIEFNASGVNQATYQAARTACASLRGGGAGNASSEQNLANELKFAKCMRAHGVPDFPDPNKNGGFSGSSMTIDPQSASFQSAQAICTRAAGLSGGSGSSS